MQAKPIANLDQKSRRFCPKSRIEDFAATKQAINLAVLRRIDPNIEKILITVCHVTFYEFNIELSQWSRKDVEGSAFVVERRVEPRYQFIVMNRLNPDDLVENLVGDIEYEVQGPFLFYCNAAQEVNAIWFYNQRECEEVANLFNSKSEADGSFFFNGGRGILEIHGRKNTSIVF